MKWGEKRLKPTAGQEFLYRLKRIVIQESAHLPPAGKAPGLCWDRTANGSTAVKRGQSFE